MSKYEVLLRYNEKSQNPEEDFNLYHSLLRGIAELKQGEKKQEWILCGAFLEGKESVIKAQSAASELLALVESMLRVYGDVPRDIVVTGAYEIGNDRNLAQIGVNGRVKVIKTFTEDEKNEMNRLLSRISSTQQEDQRDYDALMLLSGHEPNLYDIYKIMEIMSDASGCELKDYRKEYLAIDDFCQICNSPLISKKDARHEEGHQNKDQNKDRNKQRNKLRPKDDVERLGKWCENKNLDQIWRAFSPYMKKWLLGEALPKQRLTEASAADGRRSSEHQGKSRKTSNEK